MFNVLNALVCDIVRPEGGGKYYCLGIYPKNAIFLPDFSLSIFLSFFLDITSSENQVVDVHFILEDRVAGDVFLSAPGKVELKGYGTPALVGGPYEIKARGPCVVHFSAIAGGQKIELISFTINRAASPTG